MLPVFDSKKDSTELSMNKNHFERKTTKKAFPFIITLIIVLVFTLSGSSIGKAQSNIGTGWSQPELLFKGEGRIGVQSVVADQSGFVHIFWTYDEAQSPDTQGETSISNIDYMRWDGTNWSNPVDIISTSDANAPSAATGLDGKLHLIWAGAMDQIYYSQANVNRATSAAGWKTKILVDEGNVNNSIIADQHGHLHVVYSGKGSAGVFYLTSSDSGNTWSAPVNISSTASENTAADFPRISVSKNGVIHVVWTEFQLPTAWPPTGIYYSHSWDNGKSWSVPVQIDGPGYTQINVAADDKDNVFVAWNGMAGVQGRYSQWSQDNGQSWSDIYTFHTPKIGGSEGPPQLVIDSSVTPHLLMTDGGCVWYSSWDGDNWLEPACLSKSYHIEQPTLGLGDGNQLYAVFWHDLGSSWQLWYTTRHTDAPYIQPVAFPTDTPTPTLQPVVTPTQVSESIFKPTLEALSGGLPPKANPPDLAGSLFVSILPAFLVVFLFFLIRALFHRNH